jgi:hypothetical protein
MDISDWKSMSTDELWDFKQQIAVELSYKIKIEKAALEKRLRQLAREPYRPRSSEHGLFMHHNDNQKG